MKEDKTKVIEVFSGSPWEVDFVKSLLDNRGIEAVTKGSMLANLVLPATVAGVAILINEKDYEAAMEVIREYEDNKDGE